MPRTIDRAVVFDLDGTLVLCESVGDVIADILTRYGATRNSARLRETISAANSDWALVESCVPMPARNAAYEEVLRVNAKAAASSQCDARIVPMLALLGSEYRLFLLSGRDERSIGLILERHQIDSCFEAIVGAGPHVAEKPDPSAFRELLAWHGIDARRATYIGDKDVDSELARRAGVAFVGVTWYGERLTGDCTRIAAPTDLPSAVAQMYRARSSAV